MPAAYAVRMRERGIERLDVMGFASILESEVELGALNVLVGVNGAGKSNLVRALELPAASSTRTCGSMWPTVAGRRPWSTLR